ncbi:unnamed protein product [Symbiodinium pilosum]|uniref:RxLR effector protein n=1 Tax=Symbiodinium pilosum TaxID=2952 RepID=A0A812XE58_SYMPI|nr:unnamed protein product [Symbiodinium pilosum]
MATFRSRGLLPIFALAALAICLWRRSDDGADFALPPTSMRPKAAPVEEPAAFVGAYEKLGESDEPVTAMSSRHIKQAYYNDGWRHGGINMWIEDKLDGNWMNVNALKNYTYASGRLKPRVLTKLRMSDHKRAVRYIKRFRQLGIMPYHRLLAKIEKDPAAKRPPKGKTSASYGVNRAATKEVAESMKELEEKS